MTSIDISYELENACKMTAYKTSNRQDFYGNEIVYTYHIENKEVINVLRELYKATKNSFVKNVVKTVGVNKKMSEKQLNIIADELVNFQEITINF